jgi:hypothetical protein
MRELVRLKHVGDAARRALNLIPHTHHEDVAHRKRSKFRHVERDAAKMGGSRVDCQWSTRAGLPANQA